MHNTLLRFITLFYLLLPVEHQLLAENSKDKIKKAPFVNPISLMELLPTLESGNVNEKTIRLISGGCLSLRVKNYKEAEQQWIEALNDKNLPSDIRKAILQQLANLYILLGNSGKEILLYEKYVESFDNDPSGPHILFELGNLYRSQGAVKLALKRYYDILQRALTVSQSELKGYRLMIAKVQMAIAETYFEMNDLPKALELFSKLQLNTLTPENRRKVLFKKIYCQYHLKKYLDAFTLLAQFCDDSINDAYSAEAMFLKIKTLKALNRRDETVSIILDLLKTAQKYRKSQAPNWKQWDYWQKEAARQVAKEFYNENEFINALTIYQVMVGMDTTPIWQWPILHAIGLCYERLHLLQRAEAAYRIITSAKDVWNEKTLRWTELLKSYQEDCLWRLQQLQKLTESQMAVEMLLQNQAPLNPNDVPKA